MRDHSPAGIWLVVLACKFLFDLHIFIQQHRLLPTLQAPPAFEEQWDVPILGYHHPIIVVFSWLTLGTLYMLDTYILFTLIAAFVALVIMRKVSSRRQMRARWR